MLETSRVRRVIWPCRPRQVRGGRRGPQRGPGEDTWRLREPRPEEGCPAAGFSVPSRRRGACLNATKLSSLKIFWRPSAASGSAEGAQRKTSSGGTVLSIHREPRSKPEETLLQRSGERGRPRPSCQFTITVLPYRAARQGCELARRSHGLRELLREAAAAGMEMGPHAEGGELR